MNKKTKMWLGVGVVAAAAYYFWHKSKTASFANQTGSMTPCPSNPSEILVGVETGGGRRIMCVAKGGSEIHYYPTAKTPKGYR